MPGLSLATEGYVIGRRPPTERFSAVQLFSAEHGHLSCFLRVSRRPHAPSLDLFDEVDASLQSSNEGRTWFFREVRVLTRHSGIALRLTALHEASAFAALVARNPVPAESRQQVTRLLRQALAAWSETHRPDIVAFKALYAFARDEGHPVKEAWLAGLRGRDRELAVALLQRPVAELDATTPEAVQRLLGKLRDYLRANTELLFPDCAPGR
jgi:hypothetical protein